MKRDPFIALSATFFDDPDVAAAGHMPTLLYLQMACRCRQLRSDGFIHEVHVRRLGFPKWQTHLAALVQVGLVTEHTDAHSHRAWFIPAYLKWNWSEDQWLRRQHEGVIGACRRHHDPNPPCEKEKCRTAAAWLAAHPQPVAEPIR